MTYVIPFSKLNKRSIGVAGGKGANLGEMTTAGFPVPVGFVVSTDAYTTFVEANNLQEKILQAAANLRANEAEAAEAASETIRQLFLAAEMPAEIAAAVVAAHAELGQDSVAVRSSATAEDLTDASFAGQQDTYLNVQGRDALLDAVKRCWASLWTARAITYRIRQGIAPDDVSLAVVIQRQIESDVSGVAFSLNPNNNDYDEAAINSSFGLGESIVSGMVTPDNFVVNKVTHAIVAKQVAAKEYAIVGTAGGGTKETKPADPRAASLTDAQVLEVTELVTRVESHYKLPMDIEWAYTDGMLYLLQARPITTYVPLPEMMITKPGAEKYLYLDMIVTTQGFQESLSVMGNEIWGQMLERIKGDMGMFDRGMGGGVLNTEGRQYLHLSNLIKGLGERMASSVWTKNDKPTRLMIESLDLNSYIPAETPAPMRGQTLRMLSYVSAMVVPMLRGMRNTDKTAKEYDASFAKDLVTTQRLAQEEMPFRNLVDQGLDLFNKQVASSAGMIGVAGIARQRLNSLFKDDNVSDLLVSLHIDLIGNPTAEMGKLMFALAKFPEVQETATGEEFAQKLANREFSAEFLAAYDEYTERFGCRCIREIDIATERPYENVPAFFKQLKALDIHNDVLGKGTKRRQDAYDRLLALATEKGKADFFKKQVHMQDFFGYREMPKYYFIFMLDLLRRRALQLGEQMVAQGRLDKATQVFDIRVAQLTEAQTNGALDLRALAAANLAPRAKQAMVHNWPRLIDSRGRIPRPVPMPVKEGELVGEPIAPGVVRGIANVLHAPYEKPLRQGEILVTRASDPGWTPIFMNAAGVVLEVGGAMQHGAIIAREYGLPCVTGVENIFTRIVDGSMIEVDGTNGIVRMVEALEAAEVAEAAEAVPAL